MPVGCGAQLNRADPGIQGDAYCVAQHSLRQRGRTLCAQRGYQAGFGVARSGRLGDDDNAHGRRSDAHG